MRYNISKIELWLTPQNFGLQRPRGATTPINCFCFCFLFRKGHHCGNKLFPVSVSVILTENPTAEFPTNLFTLRSPGGLLRAKNTDSKVLFHKNTEFTTYHSDSRQMKMMQDYLVPGLFSTNALNSKCCKII